MLMLSKIMTHKCARLRRYTEETSGIILIPHKNKLKIQAGVFQQDNLNMRALCDE